MGKLLLIVQVILLSSSVTAENNGSFPHNFLFGVGTSAYQTEGAWNVDGKGENIWDHWIHEDLSHIEDHETADLACDSYHWYKSDIAAASAMNVSHYQFSISWSKILPNGNDVNVKGILYYKQLIATIIDSGIIPVATLYHQDLPQALQNISGWTNPEMVNYFVKYAKIAFENFDNVGYWLTFNDPRITCRLGYGAGTYAPGISLDAVGDYLCAYVLIKAHAATYHLYKNEFSSQTAKMSIAIDLEWTEPYSESSEDAEAAERRKLFEFGLYANPIYKGNWPQTVIDRVGNRSKNENLSRSRLPEFTQEEIDYIKGTSDFMAVNIFATYRIRDIEEPEYGDPSYANDIKMWIYADPDWQISSDGKPIVPWGARKALVWLKNTYNNPEIFITGNGVSNSEIDSSLFDNERAVFYYQYLNAILDAMYEDYVKVFGYTAWSLLDCFEWTKGYSKPYGFYQVNRTNPVNRVPKLSTLVYARIANTHRIYEPNTTTTITTSITSSTSSTSTTDSTSTTTTPPSTTPDAASQIAMCPFFIFVIVYLSHLLF